MFVRPPVRPSIMIKMLACTKQSQLIYLYYFYLHAVTNDIESCIHALASFRETEFREKGYGKPAERIVGTGKKYKPDIFLSDKNSDVAQARGLKIFMILSN